MDYCSQNMYDRLIKLPNANDYTFKNDHILSIYLLTAYCPLFHKLVNNYVNRHSFITGDLHGWGDHTGCQWGGC